MRLGIFGYWTMARGQGIVNQRLYQALTELGHTVYVLSRPCDVGPQRLQDTTGPCAVPHLRLHGSYQINPNTLRSWATFEKLDAVMFSEEYDFSLPMTLQRAGIKTLTWIDAFIGPAWRPLLKAYDQLWCITHRAESILLDWHKAAQTQFIGWGVPADFWVVRSDTAPRFDFMHQAGWIGMDARKGTDTLLAALALMGDDAPELLLHCQLPEAVAKQALGYESWPPHVIYEDADVPPPGLYHTGRVVVQPSKIEGIGLAFPEAMCAGRPVMTVNAAPMNEFVTPETGWLVDADAWKPHVDGSLYNQAIVHPDPLAKAMREAMSASDELISEKARLTLTQAHNLFGWEAFKARIGEGLGRMGL